MNTVVIDFETYYKKRGQDAVSVSDLGNRNYANQSYWYLVSVVSPDLGIKFVGTPEDVQREFGPDGLLQLTTDPNNHFVAANSNFDRTWTQKAAGAVCDGTRWHCVLDKGAVQQYPQNLSGLAHCVLGQKMDKSARDEMDGVHWAELDESRRRNLKQYCLEDSLRTLECWNKLPEPSAIETALAEHTRRISWRGVHVDTDLMERDKTMLLEARQKAFLQIPWHNDDKPLSAAALGRWASARGIPVPASLAKTSEECDDLMVENPALREVIEAMRWFRKANTIVKKIEDVEARITNDGTMPIEMLYCGARHTRRWSSRGFNIQNLDRSPIVFPETFGLRNAAGEPASFWSRHWILPPPGKKLLSLDYAQVEPRCLNWLVGNEELLEGIRAGYSVYEAYARVAKGWKGAPGTLKKELGVAAYTLIKNEVLGLGYGMGASRYCDYAGVDVATAEKTVEAFRRTNPKIIKFWYQMDEQIKRSAFSKSQQLEIEMPTGDTLRHFCVRARAGGRGFESYTTKLDFSHNSHQPSLWGGTLVENIVQRMARDVLGEAIIRVEEAGFHVMFSAHDELVLAVDSDNAEDAKAEAAHIMSQTPEWCAGLPLAVEGELSDRYAK